MSTSLERVIPEKEWNKIRFPVHKKGDGIKIAREWYEEFKELSDQEIKYICLLYDKESPLTKHFRNLEQRKQYVASMVGFASASEGAEGGEASFDLSRDCLIAAVLAFLKDQNDKVWEQIVALEQVYYEFMENLIKRVHAEKEEDQIKVIERKDKLVKAIGDYAQRLNVLYDEFFRHDPELEQTAKQEVIKRIKPESIARAYGR